MTTEAGTRRTALATGCTVHAVQDGLMAATYVLLPILAQAFGLTYAQVGLFKGLKALAQAVFEMWSGLVAERVGNGAVLVFGLTLAGAGFGLLSMADGTLLVMACLLVIGTGAAFQHAPASALVSAAYAAGGRRGALGLYNSAGDAGKLVFAGLFSLAVGAGLAWQGVAVAYGLVALAVAAGVVVAMRMLARRLAETPAPHAAAPAGWGIRDRRAFGGLMATVFLDTMVQSGVLVFVAFLMLEKGLSLPTATMATVVVLAGGIFGKAGCGFLADRIGVRRAFVLIQVLTAAGLVLVAVAPAWLAFVLLAPLGVVVQGSTSITYGLVPDLVDSRRVARGYALMYASASFSSAAGPFAFGLIGDAAGIGTAMAAMAGVALLAVPPIILIRAFAHPGGPA